MRFLHGVAKFHTLDTLRQELLYRVEEAGNEITLDNGPAYVVQAIDGGDEPLFWSNDLGWVELESATRFTINERAVLNPPLGGIWAEDPEAPEPIEEMRP